jgi:hypothetical protein
MSLLDKKRFSSQAHPSKNGENLVFNADYSVLFSPIRFGLATHFRRLGGVLLV